MSKEAFYQSLAKDILDNCGGSSNISGFTHCMTRLRITPLDQDKTDIEALKQLDGVIGVVEAETLQIILGTGVANHVADAFAKLMSSGKNIDLKEAASRKKADLNRKNTTPITRFLRKISSIFIPLIPALIASGLITGITKAVIQAGWLPKESQIALILTVIGSGLFTYLGVLVGINAAKEFGGTPAMGGLAGILILNPEIANISLFGENLLPGRGGLIGVLFAAVFIAYTERFIRKYVHQSIDIIVTPTLSLLITGLVTYVVFIPAGGFISDLITSGLLSLLNVGGVLSGFVLGAAFLPLVVTGLHQGLTPVHLELIRSIGDDPLLPILAMGGAGQVGAAFAIFMKTKKASLKRAIGGGLPSGLLGIGEPLIFGVTLPLGRPFLTACLGAGIGGAFQAHFQVATFSIGVSGLPLSFLVQPAQIVLYIIGLFISYAAGFVFTYAFGFKDDMAAEFE